MAGCPSCPPTKISAALRYPALRWWNPTGVMSSSRVLHGRSRDVLGVHPGATNRAVAAWVIGSFVCEDSMALTSVTNRRPFASGAASSEIFSQPMVSTGAPPAARIRLIRRRTSGQSPGGATTLRRAGRRGRRGRGAPRAPLSSPRARLSTPRGRVSCASPRDWSRSRAETRRLEPRGVVPASSRSRGTPRERARAGTRGKATSDSGRDTTVSCVLLVSRSDDVGATQRDRCRDEPPCDSRLHTVAIRRGVARVAKCRQISSNASTLRGAHPCVPRDFV